MRTMYDAVTASNVPLDAEMVAGYIDGHYQSYDALVARFPNAIHVPIAVHSSTNAGIVGDVETGDMTPGSGVEWVKMRRAAGVDPTIYCSLAVWPACQAAFRAAGVAEPHWWIAAYHNPPQPVMFDGAVAHQYQDYQGLYDLSVVADYWPGVDQGQPTKEELVGILVQTPGSAAVFTLCIATGQYSWQANPDTLKASVFLHELGLHDTTIHPMEKATLKGYALVGPPPPGW